MKWKRKWKISPLMSFLFKERTSGRQESFLFVFISQCFIKKYTDKVEEGKEGLTEEKNCQDRYDRYLKELDVCQQQRDQAERSVQQYEKLFQETKAETDRKNLYHGSRKSGVKTRTGCTEGNDPKNSGV